MLTRHGAVFCTTPFQLRKAIVAASRGEGRHIRQLGCTRTGAGTKAMVKAMVFAQSAGPFGPWRVQLAPEGAAPLIVWSYASSFDSAEPDR